MNRLFVLVGSVLCALAIPYAVHPEATQTNAVPEIVAVQTLVPSRSLRSSSHVNSASCHGRCSSARNQCYDGCGDVSNNPDPQAHREWNRCNRQCREEGRSCMNACDQPSDDRDDQSPAKKHED